MQSLFIKSCKISRWYGVLVCSGYHNKDQAVLATETFFFTVFLLFTVGYLISGSKIKSRDQIVNIYWIIKKARGFQKDIYFCFVDYSKAFDHVDHNCGKFLDGNNRPPYLPPEKPVWKSRSNS